MVSSLMMSLPGTPVIMYGDEIGIGEDLGAQARYAVRPPMAWSSKTNGGFSTARVNKLVQPPLTRGKFSYKNVNVEDQLADANSFLNWTRKLTQMRRQCPEFGWGTWHIQDTGCKSVFVHLCEWKGKEVLAMHNLSNKPCKFELDLKHSRADEMQKLIGPADPQPLGDCRYQVRLDAYAYGWFRINS
jgi:maltose alpha-D-glucosyltransferase / alpha-amylase